MRSVNAGAEVVSDGIQEKLVSVRRVSKVGRGGRDFGFSAFVVVGDAHGKVGFGMGKSREVPVAVKKATDVARKSMVRVPLKEGTLYHEIKFRHGASTVIMLPAPTGTGIIAGNAMRAVFEVLGVENVVSKCIGSSNPINVVRATVGGLLTTETPSFVAKKRGLPLSVILGIEDNDRDHDKDKGKCDDTGDSCILNGDESSDGQSEDASQTESNEIKLNDKEAG